MPNLLSSPRKSRLFFFSFLNGKKSTCTSRHVMLARFPFSHFLSFSEEFLLAYFIDPFDPENIPFLYVCAKCSLHVFCSIAYLYFRMQPRQIRKNKRVSRMSLPVIFLYTLSFRTFNNRRSLRHVLIIVLEYV